jgi:chemotaxis response regulator CheB
VLVQDKQSARHYGMPASVLAADSPYPPLPLTKIAPAVLGLVGQPGSTPVAGS